MDANFGNDENVFENIQTKDEQRTKKPDLYKVIIYNDHYTTMEFVVEILELVFHKSKDEANNIMLDVHKKGKGVVGVFTFDIALTKISHVHHLAKENEFPLKCSYEKA
jgi:ATP-dependent Clp protease adaptor protein ClpS